MSWILSGTIGLTLAANIHSVLGMDVSTQAIADATYNAQLNGKVAPVGFLFGSAILTYLPR